MMGLYKRGEVWWMRFNYRGQQVRQSTETADKRKAEAILGKIRAQIVEGKFFDLDPAKNYTFDEMMEKFMREYAPQKKVSTQKRYIISLKNLSRFLKGSTLSEITPLNISKYKEIRKGEGVTPATINREQDMLSKAFNLAMKQWEWCKENPCSRVSKERENNLIDRWLTLEEADRLLSLSRGYLNNQLIDIVQLALHAGMRQGEILDLRRKDIDMARKVIVIMKTKNDKPRTIPMTDTLYSIFLTKSKIIPLSGYVFATANGTRISARNLIRAFHCAIKKAGIENFTFHCLRHTAATWMVQSGVDLYTVSKILGHKNIASTQRYAHHCPESLRNGVNVLNKISTNLAHSTKIEACKVV